MIFARRDTRMKQALAAWGDVAPTLGLNAGEFRSKLIWQKDEPGRSHVVIQLKGPRDLILKQVFAAPDDANLPEVMAAQQDAFERLSPFDKAHAPEVLFANDDASIVVMTQARGKTLDAHLTAARPHAAMLRRTGAWLAAFHRSAPLETRAYQPRFMVNHVARMDDAVGSGDMAVALPDLFRACCADVPRRAAIVQDQTTVSSYKHGDFNLRNILLGPDGETGLDFKPLSTAPVGFDIARILMDYAELFQPMDPLSPGALLSDGTLNAFFDGYDVVDRTDPAVAFVPYVQLLNDWRLIPAHPAKRSWRQAARMNMIEALARNALDTT